MTQLNVTAVYWIDDENAEGNELSLEKLLNGFISALIEVDEAEAKAAMGVFLSEEALRKRAGNILNILKKKDEDDNSKIDRITEIFKEMIGDINDPEIKLASALKKLPGPLGQAERSALKALFTSDGAKWQWHTLSFTKWGTEGKTAIGQHKGDESVLLIVDLQNTSEGTPINGETVLSDVAQAGLARKTCHLVVLTSECKAAEEFKKGRQLTTQFFADHPPRNPVFALSKGRFAKSEDQLATDMDTAFANALERANLSLIQLEFATQMQKHFHDSIQVAFNALETVTIEELAFAVMHTSQDEGASELETLVRIMNIAQREEFQRAIANSEEIRATILKLRGASASTPIKKSDLESDKELLKLRCAELYDKPEVVNSLYSPLYPGDLFMIKRERPKIGEDGRRTGEKELTENLYVLVANACDLMLRSEGNRHLDTGMLLHIDEATQQGEKAFRFELRHLEFTGIQGSSTKQIELRKYTSVPLSLLDLCWTNSEGECKWDRTQNAPNDHLRDSQRNRLKLLNEENSELNIPEFRAMTLPLNIEFSSEENEEGLVSSISFGVRRVGRLSDRHAAQLVSRFSGVFGRPSEEHDFSGARAAA